MEATNGETLLQVLNLFVEKQVVIQVPPGVPQTVWQPVAVWPCAIHPVSRGNQIKYGAGSENRVALWDVTMPKEALVTTDMRLTVLIGARSTVPQTQKVVYIVGYDAPATNHTQYIVTAEERTAA